MRKDFVFKYGKHAGMTYEWVEENAPSYLAWVVENAPNMLKESKPKPKSVVQKEVKFSNEKTKTMSPNMDFFKEGPSPMSKPYLDKMKELKKGDEWNF